MGMGRIVSIVIAYFQSLFVLLFNQTVRKNVFEWIAIIDLKISIISIVFDIMEYEIKANNHKENNMKTNKENIKVVQVNERLADGSKLKFTMI